MVYQVIAANIRELIIQSYEDGKKVKVIAETYAVKYETVRTIIKTWRKFGKDKRARGHRKAVLNQQQIELLHDWVDEDCQRTLQDYADKIEETFNIKVSRQTVANYLDKVHFTIKRVSRIPIGRNRQSTIEERKLYGARFMELDHAMTLFVDEAGVSVHCRTNYGRSKRGSRANVEVRAVKGKNYSICAAISMRNLEFYQVQENAYNIVDFVDWIKQLMDFLPQKKHYIIMDNVRFHHAAQVEQCITEKGHELIFLPPYSPFLNPIENMFSQLKYYIKRLRPSTADEVFEAVRDSSEMVDSDNCQAYWRNMMRYVSKSLTGEPIQN